MRLILIIFIFFQTTLYAQRKLYVGFVYNTDMFTNVKIDKSYLSEYPMFIRPLKLDNKSQWNTGVLKSSSIGIYEMIGLVGGIQIKKFFLDASLSPFPRHGFSIVGLKLGADPTSEDSYKTIKYNFRTTDLGASFKYLLTGRKRMRLLGAIGVSSMYIHSYKTYYGAKKEHTNLNEYYLFSGISKKFYNKVSIGLEWMFAANYNVIVGVNYVKQLTSIDNSIQLNYLNLSIRAFKYFEKYKKIIYIDE